MVKAVKEGTMYEHHFGGTVIITKVKSWTVEFVNKSIPDMEFGKKEEWDLEKFIKQFSYVTG